MTGQYVNLICVIADGDPDTDCGPAGLNATCDFNRDSCGYTTTAVTGNATWERQSSSYNGVYDTTSSYGKFLA